MSKIYMKILLSTKIRNQIKTLFPLFMIKTYKVQIRQHFKIYIYLIIICFIKIIKFFIFCI